jgi:hypothetical protein
MMHFFHDALAFATHLLSRRTCFRDALAFATHLLSPTAREAGKPTIILDIKIEMGGIADICRLKFKGQN